MVLIFFEINIIEVQAVTEEVDRLLDKVYLLRDAIFFVCFCTKRGMKDCV